MVQVPTDNSPQSRRRPASDRINGKLEMAGGSRAREPPPWHSD